MLAVVAVEIGSSGKKDKKINKWENYCYTFISFFVKENKNKILSVTVLSNYIFKKYSTSISFLSLIQFLLNFYHNSVIIRYTPPSIKKNIFFCYNSK